MNNPFDEILLRFDSLDKRLKNIEGKLSAHPNEPQRIPFLEFCERFEISKPTAYAWEQKGLIKTEKVGRKRYVITDSITINTKKFHRVAED